MDIKRLVQEVRAESEVTVERIGVLLENEVLAQDKNGIIFVKHNIKASN